MSDILTSADWPSLRVMLGGVDDTALPDATIENELHLTFVETLVKFRFPTWATMKTEAGANWTFLRVGTTFWLCARLLLWLITSENSKIPGTDSWQIGDYEEEFSEMRKVNYKTQVETYEKLAEEAFAHVSPSTTHTTRLSIFKLGGKTSGNTRIPSTFGGWHDKLLPDYVVWDEGEDNE